jgi:hypothetical protein
MGRVVEADCCQSSMQDWIVSLEVRKNVPSRV